MADGRTSNLALLMMRAEEKIIRTEAGILHLISATIDQLRGLARYWPMELLSYAEGSPDFGLVFQHGDEEIYGVKMQFLDMAQADARMFHGLTRQWIASALPRYLAMKHQGVMVPCDENEPVWSYLVRAGFSKLPYASMVPAGFAGAPPADLEHR